MWLCLLCHQWTHSHPFDARRTGFIVSRYKEPGDQPVVARFGSLLLGCDGRFNYYIEEQAQ